MQEILGSPPKRPRQVKNTQLTTKAGRLLVWSSANKQAKEQEAAKNKKRKNKEPTSGAPVKRGQKKLKK